MRPPLIFAIIMLAIGFGRPAFAQDTMDIHGFMYLVAHNHPVAKQAGLLTKKADEGVRMARGGFDPSLFGYYDQKKFKGVDYYRTLEAGLKVPLWAGLSLKGGYEQSEGEYVNPEHTTPGSGLTYAGVGITLGQGLFIDERRAVLRQAQVYQKMAEAERNLMLNDLLFDACQAFWEWAYAYGSVRQYQQMVSLARVRLDAVKESFWVGDRAAVDTLEAYLQWQDRLAGQTQALADLQQARFKAATFLWNEQGQPLEPSESMPVQWELPSGFSVPDQNTLNDLVQLARASHPYNQAYQFKLNHLDIERRWKAEKLKPKINLNYNLLSGSAPWDTENLSVNHQKNYKWGLEFSFPIFLRQERGNLNITKIKIQETTWARDQKSLEVANKMRAYHAESLLMAEQAQRLSQMTDSYAKLLEAEKIKFDIGESSLFLVNARENKWLEAQLKLIKAKTTLGKTVAGFGWAGASLRQMVVE